MSRPPRKQPFTLTIDLLGDWRPLAAPPPTAYSDHDWRYFGTITFNGVSGALAWTAGDYGIAVGDRCAPTHNLAVFLNHNLAIDRP